MTRISVSEMPMGASVDTVIGLKSNVTSPHKKKVTFVEAPDDSHISEIRARLNKDKESFLEKKNKAKTKKVDKIFIDMKVFDPDNTSDASINLPVPKSAIQFISDWRSLKGRDDERSSYIRAIPPTELPIIFKNSLESDILSDILNVLLNGTDFAQNNFIPVLPYMNSLCEVKRFSALVMFLSDADKEGNVF
jgi:RNA polymerase II-associated protein 3